MRFRLCFKGHGGSGLNMSFEYADKLELQEMQRFYDRLDKRLKEEADQMKRQQGQG